MFLGIVTLYEKKILRAMKTEIIRQMIDTKPKMMFGGVHLISISCLFVLFSIDLCVWF